MRKWLVFSVWTLILGWGFLFINIASDQLNAIEQTTIRAVIATLLMWAYIVIRGISIPFNFETIRAFVILGVANRSLTFLLLAWSQEQGVPSGLSSVLLATNPLFSMIIAHFVFADERINILKIVGVIAGFIGVIILASRNINNETVFTDTLMGQGAVVLAALLFAWTTVYTRQVMQNLKLTPFNLAAGSTAIGGGFMLIVTAVNISMGARPPAINTLNNDTIIAILILSIFNSLIAVMLANYIIREVGASRANTQAYIVPIIALALGAIFLDEVIDMTVIIATTIILGGVAVANIGSYFINRNVQVITNDKVKERRSQF